MGRRAGEMRECASVDPREVSRGRQVAVVACLCESPQRKPRLLAVVTRDGFIRALTGSRQLPAPTEDMHVEEREIAVYCTRCTPRRDMLFIDMIKVSRTLADDQSRRPLRIDVRDVGRRQSDIVRGRRKMTSR